MTTIEYENNVTVNENKLEIRNFQTSDSDIVSYFANLSESENLDEKFLNALKVGVVAAKTISTAGNVSYVEKAFAGLDTNFKQTIDKAFGENGQFYNLLNGHFGEDGKIIKELFDPHREGSPLFSMKRDLEFSLAEIKDKIAGNIAAKQIMDKSTQKGFVFEDYCEQKLEWISNIHSDKLERTGDMVGKIPSSKKGDFVLTLGDIGKKIVFEMKDKERVSLKDIQSELKEAIENRESHYGIFVAKNRDSLPESVGWFNEYDGNHLVCALEDNDGTSMIDGEVIHIAYKWARARLRIQNSVESKLDVSFVMKKASDIQSNLDDLRKIKRDCTSIETATGSIKEQAKNIKTQIESDLEEILQSIQVKDESTDISE